MGWQSPQPGHQSAGSLRKHLRELGRQLKGADWHYRKVTRAWCASPSSWSSADSPGGSGDQHGPVSLGRHRRDQAGLARAAGRAWAASGIAAAVLPSVLPNLRAQGHPPSQSHSYSNRLAERFHFHKLSHSEGVERGSPAYKITPLASSYTARAAHRPSSAPRKKADTIALLTRGSHLLRQKPPEEQEALRQTVHPAQDILQICPASPPTCDLHRLLVVEAVVAASFRDLCPKRCLQKQVSEPARAQRSRKRPNTTMQKVNRCRVSPNSTPVRAIPGPQPLSTTQQTVWS